MARTTEVTKSTNESEVEALGETAEAPVNNVELAEPG